MSPEADALVIGVDCSTTACKAIVWSRTGEQVSEGRAPIALTNVEPEGWEQDANAWWAATTAAISEALGGLSAPDRMRIRALCCAAQRETFVLADHESRPLGPALVWMDDRCHADVEHASSSLGAAALHELTGKPPCTTPSFYKLLFALGRTPSLRSPSLRVMDVHGFLVQRLTGRFVTSIASADPTGLVDMRARRWAPSLLAYAGLSESSFASLVEPGAVIATLARELVRAWGLPDDVVVVAGAGDGQAAGLGAGLREPGRAYLNLGTALVSGVLSREYTLSDAFRTLYACDGTSYFLETDLRGGAFTVSWLVERFLPPGEGDAQARLAALERDASRLPAGASGLVVVPYWNGVMNPYWDAQASGLTLGFRGHHTAAHLYRAIVEGLALEQRLHTEGVEHATGQAIDEFVVMGGGARSVMFCQIVADVTGKRLRRGGTVEATALGAGILAARAAGLFASLDDAISEMTRVGPAITPGADAPSYDTLYRDVYRHLYPTLRGAMASLAAFTRRASASERSQP